MAAKNDDIIELKPGIGYSIKDCEQLPPPNWSKTRIRFEGLWLTIKTKVTNWAKFFYVKACNGCKVAAKLLMTFYILPYANQFGRILLSIYTGWYGFLFVVLALSGKWTMAFTAIYLFWLVTTIAATMFWAYVGIVALWRLGGKQLFQAVWEWSDTPVEATA
tara:strand:- start:441 stop:926 length:486 start_codon:yes stop_codon:yes gene_type:complete